MTLEATAYLGLCVLWVTLASQPSSATSDAGAIVALSTSMLGTVRAVIIKDRVFGARPAYAAP